MTTMVERVARALCPYKDRPCPWGACSECSQKARAAIKALREPTDEMLKDGGMTEHFNSAPEEVWSAMISAALGEDEVTG